ncbi:hypothetical protein KEM55_003418 [Ascosphaera atra]|nr:hypothetical protein KEM55_003418 [Ascosphaera atra]
MDPIVNLAPSVRSTAEQLRAFYTAKALYWVDIPPQVLATIELVTGRASRAPKERDTLEEEDLARYTRRRHDQPSVRPLWPPLWSTVERTDLNQAIIAFYNKMKAVRELLGYKRAYVHLIAQGGFGKKPLGPVSLCKVPPFVPGPDPVLLELRQCDPMPEQPSYGMACRERSSNALSERDTVEDQELACPPPVQQRLPQGSPPPTAHKRGLAERSPNRPPAPQGSSSSTRTALSRLKKKSREQEYESGYAPQGVTPQEEPRMRPPWPSSSSDLTRDGSPSPHRGASGPSSSPVGDLTVGGHLEPIDWDAPRPHDDSHRGSPMTIDSNSGRMDISFPSSSDTDMGSEASEPIAFSRASDLPVGVPASRIGQGTIPARDCHLAAPPTGATRLGQLPRLCNVPS